MQLPLRAVLALVLSLLSASSGAAESPIPGSLREQFPAIDSVERADAALALTGGAKGRVEREYKSDARECTAKILVNDCLEKARELQRQRLADIDAVELDANRFKRRDKANRIDAERAKHEAERAANAAADDTRRAASRKAYEDRQAQSARDAAAAAAKTAAPRTRKPVLTPPPSLTPADAQKHEKNAVDYAAKQKEAAVHLKDIERRSAEKVADRKRRADERKAKEAKAAAAAPAT